MMRDKEPGYVLAFDIYGTLLDTSKIAEDVARQCNLEEQKALDVSALWRRYQLEYTWRLNSMGIYESFDVVTEKSLRHALAEFSIRVNDETVEKLMDAYNSLKCFPDSAETLKNLESLDNVKTMVFSNGTQAMVQSALKAASIQSLPSGMFVADSVRKYKPAREIYHALAKAVGKASNPQDIVLVSGNPFDVTGALSAGLRAIWVDRSQKGWVDHLLGEGQKPTAVVHGLDRVVNFVKEILLQEPNH